MATQKKAALMAGAGFYLKDGIGVWLKASIDIDQTSQITILHIQRKKHHVRERLLLLESI